MKLQWSWDLQRGPDGKPKPEKSAVVLLVPATELGAVQVAMVKGPYTGAELGMCGWTLTIIGSKRFKALAVLSPSDAPPVKLMNILICQHSPLCEAWHWNVDALFVEKGIER